MILRSAARQPPAFPMPISNTDSVRKQCRIGALGSPEHTCGQARLHCLGPSLLRHHLFAPLRLLGRASSPAMFVVMVHSPELISIFSDDTRKDFRLVEG